MRRNRTNPVLPGGSTSGGGDIGVISNANDLTSQSKPIVMVLTDEGVDTYKRQADGTYKKSSSGGTLDLKLEDVTDDEFNVMVA